MKLRAMFRTGSGSGFERKRRAEKILSGESGGSRFDESRRLPNPDAIISCPRNLTPGLFFVSS